MRGIQAQQQLTPFYTLSFPDSQMLNDTVERGDHGLSS
ncbi:hypothetical protein PCLA_03r0401 [Pseudomonas citronellolis]|nr:hypothetical protein PCLA_03r0401 [Pseudomonas citronellolis]